MGRIACKSGETVELELTFYAVPAAGLAGYNMVAVVSDSAVASIVAVDFAPGYGRTSNLPADTVQLVYLNTDEAIRPTMVVVQLAKITIDCRRAGMTLINVLVQALDDEHGNPILTQIQNGQVEVADNG